MTRFGLFHRIHRQRANGIGHAIVLGARKRFGVRRRKAQTFGRLHSPREMTPAMARAMALAIGTCSRGAMRDAAVVGTGGGLITCEASKSIPHILVSVVMHRASAAALTFSRDTT
jgi:16S rRNA G1207 methylase RsmC